MARTTRIKPRTRENAHCPPAGRVRLSGLQHPALQKPHHQNGVHPADQAKQRIGSRPTAEVARGMAALTRDQCPRGPHSAQPDYSRVGELLPLRGSQSHLWAVGLLDVSAHRPVRRTYPSDQTVALEKAPVLGQAEPPEE